MWIHGNTGYIGGGASSFGGSFTLLGDTLVEDNQAYYGGAGFFAGATVVGGVFSGNHSVSFGGGAIVWGGELRDTLVVGNDAGDTGGGAFVLGRTTRLEGVTFDGNVTPTVGGGIGMDPDYLYPGDEVAVTGCTITANQADLGGGIHGARGLDLVDTVVTDTTAERGAGIYVTGATTLSDGAVLRNVAAVAGGGIELDSGSVDAVGVDFGVDVDDNLPEDVWVGGVGYSFDGPSDFTCGESGCL